MDEYNIAIEVSIHALRRKINLNGCIGTKNAIIDERIFE